MTQQIVGIADMKIARSGILTSYGFGSCVGIAMYDPERSIAGLLHIMLPDSTSFETVDNPLKFADTGIIKLHQGLIMAGARREALVCKIAGGAQVYQNKSNARMFDIGTLNARKVTEILKALKIPVIAQDHGGRFSRTLDFDIANKQLSIKRIFEGGVETIHL